MTDRRDPDRVQAAPLPANNQSPDSNMYCRLPNGELYAVLSKREWQRLRAQGKLDSALNEARERGPIEAEGQ